jgi:hypothetical protein
VITLSDSAGNSHEIIVPVEILGTGTVTNPDFWQAGTITRSPSGIDIDTAILHGQRMFFTVPLSTSSASATGQPIQFLRASLTSCTGNETGKLAGYYIVNNMLSDDPKPMIVLELDPTAQNDIEEDYTFDCQFNIYSRRGNEALTSPEQETVELTIPFYKSRMGEADRLQDKIDDQENKIKTGWWGTIGVLAEIVKYAKLACNALAILDTLRQVWALIEADSDALRSNPYTYPSAIAICYGGEEAGNDAELLGMEALDKFCKVISCRLGILNALGSDGLELFDSEGTDYDKWWNENIKSEVQTLGAYNNDDKVHDEFNYYESEKLGIMSDPYDNIVTALMHLCIPAIIWNLEKARQIECRYYGCLKNEVSSGIATMEACKELKKYQYCKYFWGAIFYAIPYVSIVDGIVTKLKNMITDPIGLLRVGFAYFCKGECATSGTGASLCQLLAYAFVVVDLAQDLIAIYDEYQGLNADYCSAVGLGGFSAFS